VLLQDYPTVALKVIRQSVGCLARLVAHLSSYYCEICAAGISAACAFRSPASSALLIPYHLVGPIAQVPDQFKPQSKPPRAKKGGILKVRALCVGVGPEAHTTQHDLDTTPL
jgi:hypothetical protein